MRVFLSINTILTLVIYIVYLASSENESTIDFLYKCMNCIVVFRLFRLIGLLKEVDSYRVVFKTATALLGPFYTLIMVLFCVFFLFAQLGVHIFGGIIYYGNNKITTFRSEPLYVLNNMNCMGTAFVNLFELLIVNNWQVLVSLYTQATNTNWTRMFFITYYFFSVNVVLNICVAFVLDMFNSQREILEAEKVADEGKLSRRVSLLQEIRQEGAPTSLIIDAERPYAYSHDTNPDFEMIGTGMDFPVNGSVVKPALQGLSSSVSNLKQSEEEEKMLPNDQD